MAVAGPAPRQYYTAPLPFTNPPNPGVTWPPPVVAVSTIRNFCRVMIVVEADVANIPNANLQSAYQAFHDALFGCTTIFRHALDSWAVANRPYGWNSASQTLNNLMNIIGNPNNNPQMPAQMPAETPLELWYEIILNIYGGGNLANGWNALIHPVNGIWKNYVAGIPEVGVMCRGTPAPPANAILVVTTCQPQFGQWHAMYNWTRNARQSYMNVPTTTRVQTAANRLGTNAYTANVGALTNAWNNAIGGGAAAADTAVYNAWAVMATGFVNPNSFQPANSVANLVGAMPFSCHASRVPGHIIQARERCRRCRVVWRFTVAQAPAPGGAPVEPARYVDGPYSNPLSCAEILAIPKCTRMGL